MPKKWLYPVLFSLAAAAFVGTSYATASEPPDLPPSLPAAALPKTAVPDDVRVATSNLISDEAASHFGITDRSFENARLLTRTSQGPVFVIPGASGLCLALANSVACSELPTKDPIVVALLVPDVSGTHQVGAGLLNAESRPVVVTQDDGSRSAADVILGGFGISSAQDVQRDELIAAG